MKLGLTMYSADTPFLELAVETLANVAQDGPSRLKLVNEGLLANLTDLVDGASARVTFGALSALEPLFEMPQAQDHVTNGPPLTSRDPLTARLSPPRPRLPTRLPSRHPPPRPLVERLSSRRRDAPSLPQWNVVLLATTRSPISAAVPTLALTQWLVPGAWRPHAHPPFRHLPAASVSGGGARDEARSLLSTVCVDDSVYAYHLLTRCTTALYYYTPAWPLQVAELAMKRGVFSRLLAACQAEDPNVKLGVLRALRGLVAVRARIDRS